MQNFFHRPDTQRSKSFLRQATRSMRGFLSGDRLRPLRSSRLKLESLEPRVLLDSDSTVLINEIMYNPLGNTETLEFIELYNQLSYDMDLSGWSLADGVEYRFPEGTRIGSGETLVIAKDRAALEASAAIADTLGPYTGSLSNGGERIALLNVNDRVMDSVDYGDGGSWPVAADGSGASLSKIDKNGHGESAAAWASSGVVGGTPGQLNFLLASSGATIVATTYVDETSPARVLVPVDGSLGLDWTGGSEPFADGAWTTGTASAGFETDPDYNALVGTNVESQMLGANASAMTRLEFTSPGSLDSLTLRMKYDDGFVAYLNGQEVARRNASGSAVSSLNIVNHYRFGEDDGVTVGDPGAAMTVDSTALTDLTKVGTPGYVSSGVPGSDLAINFENVYGTFNSPDHAKDRYQAGAGSVSVEDTNNWGFEAWVNLDGLPGAGLDSEVAFVQVGKFGGGGALIEVISGNYWIHIPGIQAVNSGVSAIGDVGKWVHLALVNDGGTGRLFRNGTQIAISDGFSGGTGEITVGAFFLDGVAGAQYARGLDGQIDEVRFFEFEPGEFDINDTLVAGITNSTGPPSFDAQATEQRPNSAAVSFEDFDLTPFLSDLAPGSNNVLAIQGLNASADDPDFLILPELVGSSGGLETTLIASGSAAKTLIPSSGALGQTWTEAAFDDSGPEWIAGTNGIGFDAEVRYNELVDIDLQASLSGSGSSALMRVPFVVTDPVAVDSFTLDIKYDDGFVAFLNGQEIARRNVPAGGPLWNASATSARDDADAIAFESIDVGAFASALVAGDNLLAIVGMNVDATDDDFLLIPRLRGQEVQRPPQLVFNEVAAATDAEFFIEIVNTGSQPAALDGLILSGSAGVGREVTLPAAVLLPGEQFAMTAAQLGFGPVDGEQLFLYTADRSQVLSGIRVDDVLRGRSEAQDGRWLYPDGPTPGAANSFDFETNIVINEIMYNSVPDFGVAPIPPTFSTQTFVPLDATWRYSNDTSPVDPGANWDDAAHPVDNVSWFESQGPLGFDTNPAALPLALNTVFEDPKANPNYVRTYYFETEFDLSSSQLTSIESLGLQYMVDDGAVFYLNGNEISRLNMPAGVPTAQTLAAVGVADAVLSNLITIPATSLVAGSNRLSVEVHQTTVTSSDVVFAAQLLSREITDPGTPGTPLTKNPQEWIELFNRSDTETVDLTGWDLNKAVKFDFPAGTSLAPNQYLVIAKDPVALAAANPSITVLGPFSGKLSNRNERIVLRDAAKNPADEVHYFESGRWDSLADGSGASLELRDPNADNSSPEAWAASDEGNRPENEWQTITYRGVVGTDLGPVNWNELDLGLFGAGEVLIDDVSLIESPDGAATQLMQNGGFEFGSDTWRFLGNHQRSEVITDPENPANSVLRLIATGPMEYNFNHIETTYAGDVPLVIGREYEISYRAKWIEGSRQLNSRLYFNRLARTTILESATDYGTPGGANSVLEANIGPVYDNLIHGPVVPTSNDPVTISVDAADPQGVASMTLFWATSGGVFTATAMSDDGAGRYSGTIPAQSNETIVQFYVEGIDTAGGASQFPAAGANSRALYKVDDAAVGAGPLRDFRLLMTTADVNHMLASTNVMSNERLGGTVIVDGTEVYYNVGVRPKGSRAGRASTIGDALGYNIQFGADQLYRGTHETIAIDRSGRAPTPRGQDEILVWQMINHAGGMPGMVNDLIDLKSPLGDRDGSAMLLMARYDDTFLNSQYDNGSDGTVFEWDLLYSPRTTIDGTREGLKLAIPDNFTQYDLQDLGDDRESYRWSFLAKNNRRADQYEGIIAMAKAFDLSGDALNEAAKAAIDVNQFLRVFGMYRLFGINDTYTANLSHNVNFYTRPEDGRVVALPFDMDFMFNLPTNASIVGDRAINLNKLIAIPDNLHYYLGNLEDIIATTFNMDYMGEWLAAYSDVLPGQNFTGPTHVNYINARGAFVLSQMPPQTDFDITTADFVVNDTTAALAGRGWVNVREVRLAGSNDPLEIVWTASDRWQLSLPVDLGQNAYTIEAYDFQGDFIGSDTINIESTAGSRPVQDFLRITELNYNPDGSDDTEFIELKNVSSGPAAVTLDLTNVTIADGPSSPYTFTAGRMLSPGELVLVVKNEIAFAAAYPSVDQALIDGEFEGGLSNAGERILLLNAEGATVVDFTYENGNGAGEEDWRAETDGNGFSLVITDENGSQDNWALGTGWRSSALAGGSPGADDPTPLAADFDGSGTVSRPDVAILLSGFGASTAAHRAVGDTNGDHMTTLSDLATVQSQLGQSLPAAPSPSPTAAPAPAPAPSSVIVGISNRIKKIDARPVSRNSVSSLRKTRSSEIDAAHDTSVEPLVASDLSRLYGLRASRRYLRTLTDAAIQEMTDVESLSIGSRLVARRGSR